MRPDRSGFTLVELLATVFILAIGLGTVFSLITLTANWSGEQVRERRRERFAETVFATVAWALGQPEDATEDPWTLPVTVEDDIDTSQALVVDGTDEVAWPRARQDGFASEIPRIFYSLSLTTNTLGNVEAELAVRMQGERDMEPGAPGEYRVFRRTFDARRPLW